MFPQSPDKRTRGRKKNVNRKKEDEDWLMGEGEATTKDGGHINYESL